MNALTVIDAPSNVEAYRTSTDAATLCKEIVVASATNIQGRKYVCVEGWQAIAIAHGCTASACDVRKVDGGTAATGQVRRMADGVVIAEAEGFVGEDEPTWYGGQSRGKTLPKRADYAIRAMAQTRAISRACRSAFAHVVVMMNAGLSTTPAEEVPLGGFDDSQRADPVQPQQVRQAPARNADEFISDSQRDELAGLAGAKNIDLGTVCKLGNIASLKDMKAGMFPEAKAWLERQKARTIPPQNPQSSDLIDDDLPY